MTPRKQRETIEDIKSAIVTLRAVSGLTLNGDVPSLDLLTAKVLRRNPNPAPDWEKDMTIVITELRHATEVLSLISGEFWVIVDDACRNCKTVAWGSNGRVRQRGFR